MPPDLKPTCRIERPPRHPSVVLRWGAWLLDHLAAPEGVRLVWAPLYPVDSPTAACSLSVAGDFARRRRGYRGDQWVAVTPHARGFEEQPVGLLPHGGALAEAFVGDALRALAGAVEEKLTAAALSPYVDVEADTQGVFAAASLIRDLRYDMKRFRFGSERAIFLQAPAAGNRRPLVH